MARPGISWYLPLSSPLIRDTKTGRRCTYPECEEPTTQATRYRIISRLGTGGMGAVYKAEDLLLGRTVALKVLTDRSLGEAEARARILREARAAAALGHPNICTIFEAGEAHAGLFAEPGETEAASHPPGDAPYLAMEFIDGPTLDALQRERRVFALPELVDIALQVAEGLAAAHQRGIVHRDLKPGNVMFTSDGRVKVLDFGLARPIEAPAPDGLPGSALETVTCELLREGRVLGTAAYISPERALGRAGDSRSDVFSFGIMLYELVSGTRPFAAETTTAVIAKVLEAEPPSLARLRPETPPALARIVGRCLRKNPEERFNDTRDLVAALRELREALTGPGAAAPRSGTRGAPPQSGDVTAWVEPPAGAMRPRRRLVSRRAAWVMAGALLVAASVWFGRGSTPRRPTPSPDIRRITMTGQVRCPVISPDGNFVAYVGVRPGEADAVFVQDLRSGATLKVLQAGNSQWLAWSADGSAVIVHYHSPATGGASTVTVPLLGGNAGLVTRENMDEFCLSPDDTRIAIWDGKNVSVVDRATGSKRVYPWAPASSVLCMAWSPRADVLLIRAESPVSQRNLWRLDLVSGEADTIIESPRAQAGPVWAPDGRGFYVTHDDDLTLMKVPVDSRTGRPTGAPVSLGMQINTASALSVSRDGRKMAYASITLGEDIALQDLQAPGGPGSPRPPTVLTGETASEFGPRLSPDGRRLLFTRYAGFGKRGRQALVISHLEDRSEQEIASDHDLGLAAWSPDGSEIAWSSSNQQGTALHVLDLETRERRTFEHIRHAGILEWAPGNEILVRTQSGRNYELLDAAAGRRRSLLANDDTPVFQARSSPDGRWVAFARMVDTRSGMSVWLASTIDGTERRLYPGRAAPVGWSADGRIVYLVREDPVAAAAGERIEEVVACPLDGGNVTRLCTIPDPARWSFVDVSGDGRRVVSTRPRTAGDIWLVENFDPDVR